jgi:hypothetical protein
MNAIFRRQMSKLSIQRFLDRSHAVSACLPSEDEEGAMALRLVQAGARDGITEKVLPHLPVWPQV